MDASETITPPALFTTLCDASKIPMTMFQVFVTMRTAAAVLNDHLKNIHVSMSCILFRSTMSWISSSVITNASTTPAMGRMTLSDKERIML